jgi:hypothetical protein
MTVQKSLFFSIHTWQEHRPAYSLTHSLTHALIHSKARRHTLLRNDFFDIELESYNLTHTHKCTNEWMNERENECNPSGPAVYGVSLRPLICWDCGLESLQGHECLSVEKVVCCQVEVSAMGQSLVQRSPTECGVSEGDREASMRSPGPTSGYCAIKIVYTRTYLIITCRQHVDASYN